MAALAAALAATTAATTAAAATAAATAVYPGVVNLQTVILYGSPSPSLCRQVSRAVRGGDFVNPNTPNDHTSFFTFFNLATLAAAAAATTTTNCATHAIMYCWAHHNYRAVRTASPPNLFANHRPP